MTDPTPRPPAGTDLAPCPDCGGELVATVGEDEGDDRGQWWCIECPGCGWVADGVDELAPFTMSGSPSTRALWAEVERLRLELAELRVEAYRLRVLATDAASFLDVDRCVHDAARGRCEVHGGQRLPCAHGEARRLLVEMGKSTRAADEAEAQAAAKEPTR